MEFLYNNHLNTSTMIYVSTGTSTAANLFDKDKNEQYSSSGDNSDLTTTTIRIDFSGYKDVNRIILQNMNFKGFKMYYNSNSANLFSVTSALTGTSEWTTNSLTNMYLQLESTISVTSLFIEATTTAIADSEKRIGQLWINNQYFSLERNPTAKNYKVSIDTKEFAHKMSDGGYALYRIAEKFTADIKLDYVSQTEHDSFYNLYTAWTDFVFVPFPTSTAWDGKIYSVNWIKSFEFEQFKNNYKDNGYTGKIRLRETPK